MSTRIRYEKFPHLENTLVSVRNFHAPKSGHMFIVYLDTKECVYKIKNIFTKAIHRGGEGINNLAVLKRNVKKHLKKLGVVFEDEMRNRDSE